MNKFVVKTCLNVFCLFVVFGALSACDKTKTTTDASSASGPSFTQDQLLTALRTVSLRANMALPPAEDVDSLIAAADQNARYQELVDEYLEGDGLRVAMIDYFRVVFGMGNNPQDAADDDPARFAAYIVTNDVNYCDLVTAKYKIDANGARIDGQDANGTPYAALGGFMTLASWLSEYRGNDFLFNYVREVANVSECYKYPDTDAVGAWTEGDIANKYRSYDENGDPRDINCFECHKTINVRRRPWLNYSIAANPQWRNPTADGKTLPPKNNNFYGHERDPFNGLPVDEPLAGSPYAFTAEIFTPADYGAQICEQARFKRCAARRFLAFALGYPAGSAGQDGKLPFDFDGSSRAGDQELLETWTGKLSGEHEMKIKTFLKDFFKSEDFIFRVNFE